MDDNFYDNARSARNEKAQKRTGRIGKDSIDASGWEEPTMETSRKTGGQAKPRAFKRGGTVKAEGDMANCHAGRKPRASGGKLVKYIRGALPDSLLQREKATLHAANEDKAPKKAIGIRQSEAEKSVISFNRSEKRKNGINQALDKLEGKAKVPARKSGGRIGRDDGGGVLDTVAKGAKMLSPAAMLLGLKKGGPAKRASGGKLLKYEAAADKDYYKQLNKFNKYDFGDNHSYEGEQKALPHAHRAAKRLEGAALAKRKLNGEANVPATGTRNITLGALEDLSKKEKSRNAADKKSRDLSQSNPSDKIPVFRPPKLARKSGGSINATGGTRPTGGRLAKASGGKLRAYLKGAEKKWNKLQSESFNEEMRSTPLKFFGKEARDEHIKRHGVEIPRMGKNLDDGMALANDKLRGKAKVPAREAHKKGGKVKGKTNIHININSGPKPDAMPMLPPAGAMPPPPMMPKPPMPPAGAMPPMAGGLPPGLGVPPPAMGAGPMPRAAGGRAARASGGLLKSYKRKASIDANRRAANPSQNFEKGKNNTIYTDSINQTNSRKVGNRDDGIDLANRKLKGEAKVPARASGGKLKKYIKAAEEDREENSLNQSDLRSDFDDRKMSYRNYRKLDDNILYRDEKRLNGIDLAKSKLSGKREGAIKDAPYQGQKAKVPARASGGRTSFHDMDAGGGGGKGRLEKAEINKRH